MRVVRRGAVSQTKIEKWGSRGVSTGRIAEYAQARGTRVTVVRFAEGSVLGTHATKGWQAFALTEGAGWVEGNDGERTDVDAGDLVVWSPGEQHSSGSERGMVVCIVETTRDPMFNDER